MVANVLTTLMLFLGTVLWPSRCLCRDQSGIANGYGTADQELWVVITVEKMELQHLAEGVKWKIGGFVGNKKEAKVEVGADGVGGSVGGQKEDKVEGRLTGGYENVSQSASARTVRDTAFKLSFGMTHIWANQAAGEWMAVFVRDLKSNGSSVSPLNSGYPITRDTSYIITTAGDIKVQKYGYSLFVDEDGRNWEPGFVDAGGYKGHPCMDWCRKRSMSYYNCPTESDSKEYCSPEPGVDHLGRKCFSECAYKGASYMWCWTDEKDKEYGFCSIPPKITRRERPRTTTTTTTTTEDPPHAYDARFQHCTRKQTGSDGYGVSANTVLVTVTSACCALVVTLIIAYVVLRIRKKFEGGQRVVASLPKDETGSVEIKNLP